MQRALTILVCLVSLTFTFVSTAAPTGSGGEAKANVSAQETERAPNDFREFEVEVLVGGRPLEEYLARGRRYVEALEGAEYELRIRNPLPTRVAVALSVDGLNTIDARRTTASQASKWVIEPYGTITIGGWQMSSARARRFYFTSERNSYAAKMGQTADLGVIAAVFYRERQPVAVVTPPSRSREKSSADGRVERRSIPDTASSSGEGANESRSERSRQPAASPQPDDDYAATGIGRSVRNDVRWMNLDLDSRPAANVTLRYEYREALVKLGVFPRPAPRPDPLRRRERASGFEDQRYSPEP